MIENNKLIAEFMGYENVSGVNHHPEYKIPSQSYELPDFDNRIMETIDVFSPYFDDMKFHSDWNWLMPVVEKIEKSGRTSVVFEQDNLIIITHSLHQMGEKYMCKQFSRKSESKIEAVYTVCVEFIKWYNHQLSKL